MIDITGKKFGKLTVIKRVGTDNHRNPTWLCRCECGNEKVIRGNLLRSGNTKSCGCITKERMAKLNLITGQYKSRVYRIWQSMKTRCFNENDLSYSRYGGRGITVCDEWRNNFKAFYEWSMTNGYDEKLTIERVDNNGNYCPKNCKWATLYEQNRNRRSNRMISFNGKTQCMLDWANELGINHDTLIARLRRGWSIEKALTTNVKH